MTATVDAVLTKGNRVVFTLRKIKVPDVSPRSYEFPTHVLSFATAEPDDISLPGAKLDPSPTVGIDQAADGTGTISITMGDAALTSVKAGESLGDLVFTYTAGGIMEVGSEVEIEIPDRWPAPIVDDEDTVSAAGEVSLVGVVADLGVSESDRTVTATLQINLDDGGTFGITYKAITAPAVGGTYTFNTRAKSSAVGTLTALPSSPTVNVNEVAAGTIALTTATGPLTSPVAPGADLGNLTFAFTADVQMANGAQVSIDIPAGWSVPFSDNNDTNDSEGEVSVTGKATLDPVSGGGAGPWTITATTNDVVESGDVITFTYKMVTSPGEGSYTFATKASASAGGVLLAIADAPSVIVRGIVADVGIEAMPATAFTEDDITVTVNLLGADGEAAKAFGAVSVMLSSSSETGVFSNAAGDPVTSVMIADNTSSGTATYSDAAAGMATITATSGEMTDTLWTVEVKSTISNLQVNGQAGMPDPVDPVRGDATIIVSANGRGGADVRAAVVVTQTITDADGTEIVSSVVSTKSLDEDPDAVDVSVGDVAYSRDVDLGGLADGDYTVTVNIGDDQLSVAIEVVNDTTAPMLSEASAKPDVVADGDQVVLRVVVASANDITSVTADVSALDSTRTEPIELTMQPDDEGVYIRVFTIDMANDIDTDGVVMVTFTATDRLGNESVAATASITLRNDVTAPTLTMASAMPSPASNGTMVYISVSSESGLTVTADASAIGGGMVTLTEGMMAANGANGMDANGMTNGMDANGMTNGMDANGMTNGMDANGMTNGMDANGMTNGMDANGMTNGNGCQWYD